jgi:hypothetical protein
VENQIFVASSFDRSIERAGGRAGRGAEWAGAATADAESNVGEAWVSREGDERLRSSGRVSTWMGIGRSFPGL